jgi:diadenosine tetraphosphatase ApaH/serine/threonine PP2A family protein phosphatase
MSIDDFNAAAAQAVLWTRERLSAGDSAWLDGLPETRVIGDFTLVHGSLREPLWEYLLNPDQAAAHLALQATPYSIIGHSHLLFRVEERLGASHVFYTAAHGQESKLGDVRAIFNPGSAGQPRDADARVSYLIYDDAGRTMTWQRVPYDIVRTQSKMRSAGIDGWLVERLAVGR